MQSTLDVTTEAHTISTSPDTASARGSCLVPLSDGRSFALPSNLKFQNGYQQF